MFCDQCGAENSTGAQFCKDCGNQLAAATQKTDNGSAPSSVEASEDGPRLWNPTVIANWTLIFTPVFGAWLNRANWLALGQSQRARAALIWFWLSVAVLAGVILIPRLSAAWSVIYLLLWYFISGRTQTLWVRERLGANYRKRGWGLPILGGTGIWMACMALALLGHGYADYVEQHETAVSYQEPPKCGEEQSLAMVRQILRDNSEDRFSIAFFDREQGRMAVEQMEIDIQGIQTVEQLDNGGYRCGAHAILRLGADQEVHQIRYSVELSDSGQIYVTVFSV